MEMITVDKGNKKLLLFSSGRIYQCTDDSITECKPKIQIIIDPKTYKVYKVSYIYFNYKKFSLPLLLAKAFIPNPNDFMKTKYKDGDVTNNNISNIEWVNDTKTFVKTDPASFIHLLDNADIGPYNFAALKWIVNDDDSELYKIIFMKGLQRYFYNALFNKGIPSRKIENYLDQGYEVLKARLKAYFIPREGKKAENAFRKYAYFCFLFTAIQNEKGTFIPRELSRNIPSDEVFEYYD